MTVTVETATGYTSIGLTTQTTLSFSIGSGSNRNLLVGLMFSEVTDISISSVTYNGTALELIETDYDAGWAFRCGWYWLGEANLPSSGAHDLVVTIGDAVGNAGVGFALSFAGASQTKPSGADNANGSDASGEITITSAANGYVVDMLYYKDNSAAQTKGGSQTQLVNVASGYMDCGASYMASAGSTTQTTWTWTGSDDWKMMGVAINEAGGGGATAPGTLIVTRNI